jgi:ABC-type Fe3+-siderophore transport system permease subunit
MTAGILWRPGIGDPTWIGWVTVAAYVIAIFSCWRTGLQARQKTGGTQIEPPAMWFACAIVLFLFGANKQLDLQTALIQFGGQMALNEGWYEHRRQVQIVFALLLGITMAVALFIAGRRQRQFFQRHPLTLIGGIFLASFTFLRSAIFNHVDEAAGVNLGEGGWMAVFELIGIGCFIVASLRAVKMRS